MVLYLLFGINMEQITQAQIDERLAQTPADRHSDAQTSAQRRAICNGCDKKQQVLGVDKCGECGCLLVFKAAFKFSACPLNKWEVPNA